MSIYYLYIKTHNKTGLKYLGKTKQDNPFRYKGSGVRWLNHIKKHGKDVSTELIAAFDSIDDLKVAGQFWSKYWNIVDSKEWANLKEESGDNGGHFSEESKKKMSLSNKGKVPWMKGRGHTDDIKKGLSIIRKGRPALNKGIPHKEITKEKIRAKRLGQHTGGRKKGSVPWNKNKTFALISNSIWINNGIINSRISKNSNIPDGFKKGRTKWKGFVAQC